MADRNELMLRSQIVRSAEALVHANEIADKVGTDDKSGWYDPNTRPELVRLQNDPVHLRSGMALMQKIYGQKLATYISGIESPALFGRWVKGVVDPEGWHRQPIRNAVEVTEILLVAMNPKLAKMWWLTPNSYIDPMGVSLPMDEIHNDPSLVRNAALHILI